MNWQPIETEPKDGTNIIILSMSGGNKKDVLFNGEANWRSEDKEALFDPISSDCFSKRQTITGWMIHDRPYRVPGVPILWHEK